MRVVVTVSTVPLGLHSTQVNCSARCLCKVPYLDKIFFLSFNSLLFLLSYGPMHWLVDLNNWYVRSTVSNHCAEVYLPWPKNRQVVITGNDCWMMTNIQSVCWPSFGAQNHEVDLKSLLWYWQIVINHLCLMIVVLPWAGMYTLQVIMIERSVRRSLSMLWWNFCYSRYKPLIKTLIQRPETFIFFLWNW